MVDLNDLRIFERVAVLRSFAAASRELDVPRSSVSRSVQRLEAALGVRLLQRTTRDVTLTGAGAALTGRCTGLLGGIDELLDDVGGLGAEPRGTVRISAGIGFGLNVLSALLPDFLRRHPSVDAVLDLSSAPVDLVGDRVDVAIRMGPMPDSQIVARKLGVLHRYLCASPDYLAVRGTPEAIGDLDGHDLVDLPVREGRRSVWVFSRDGDAVEHRQAARLYANCAVTIHRMLLNGAGIGMSSGYLCAPDIASGRLVRLLPEWRLPPVIVHAVFPSQRQLAPAVRAFVDFLCENSREGHDWQCDPLASGG